MLIGGIMVFLLLFRHGMELHVLLQRKRGAIVERRWWSPGPQSDAGSIIREADHHDWTNTVMHTVIADTPETALAAPPGGAEAPTSHDDRAEAKPLDLQAEALLHVVVLHDVDF